jgi:hypothetical protein
MILGLAWLGLLKSEMNRFRTAELYTIFKVGNVAKVEVAGEG